MTKTDKIVMIAIAIFFVFDVLFFLFFVLPYKNEQEDVSYDYANDIETTVSSGSVGVLETDSEEISYKMITMDDAKSIFETKGDYIILDVRRADEFSEGHIPGAINIANEDIGDEEISELPDKDQIIYVYCRSGNRSKQAASKLVALGYTNIIEFGGILDWTGEIEK